MEILTSENMDRQNTEIGSESDSSASTSSTLEQGAIPKRDFLKEYRILNRGRSINRTRGDDPGGRGRGRGNRGGAKNSASRDRYTPVEDEQGHN